MLDITFHYQKKKKKVAELEEHIVRLREELDREREEHNYFQLERKKMHTFWEITNRQLEEKKAELQNKDLEMEGSEKVHLMEIKDHKEELTKLCSDFERQVREIEGKYKKKMQVLREELDLWQNTEIHGIEERKNIYTYTLMKNNEKAFRDIKNYYNYIILNNLALINTLKEQVEDMKKKEERLKKEMAEVQLQNKRLTEPLRKTKDEVAELQKQLANYNKDKASLAGPEVADKAMKDLKWERDVFYSRFEKVQSERDELY
ncbi:dynein regulatory complex subunit 4 [Amia ocellicauda]|uniref:dynein regulatory complex subunit 4 n=1 Tax=Amia ocellicauda TaxID=2972642 RepID=UPI0034649C51